MPRIPPGHSDPAPHKATPRPDSAQAQTSHPFHDADTGPHSGRWLLPLIGLGLCFWIMLGASLLGAGGAGAAPALFLPAPRP